MPLVKKTPGSVCAHAELLTHTVQAVFQEHTQTVVQWDGRDANTPTHTNLWVCWNMREPSSVKDQGRFSLSV